jgi:hypothetical protein
MIDNPEQAERLLARLQAALPLPARVTPELAATLQTKNTKATYRRPARSLGSATLETKGGLSAASTSAAGARHRRYQKHRCIAPGSLDTRLLLSGGPHYRLVPRCSGVTRTAQAVLLDEPLGVITGDEVADGVTDLVEGLVDLAVHDLLFQRAEEALDDTIRLGFADERVAGGHTPEADLVMEMFGEERAAVIVSQRQATGDARARWCTNKQSVTSSF